MPGFELIGKEERAQIDLIFNKANGVMFAHGFDAIRNGQYMVRDFEKEVCKAVGAEYGQAVSSGSTALLTALKAMGIGPGDEVITQSFTFVATVEAILMLGAVPVITEVDDTYNMDPDDLRKKITARTKLVIPVHMAGVIARMDEILQIASQHGIPVMEDAAQGLGARYKGKMAGTIGDAGTYSFDFAKLVTCGEGGMVVTNKKGIFFEARCFHDHGHEYNPAFGRALDTRHALGINYRMSELQAAVGIAQIRKLDFVLERQKSNKKQLKDALLGLPLTFRTIPDPLGDAGDTILFAVEDAKRAEAIVKKLSGKGVSTKNVPDAIGWHFAATWDHMLANYYPEGVKNAFPRSKELLERSIALPVMIKWTGEQIEEMAGKIKDSF